MKKFKELADGTLFKFADAIYKKIPEERISCCKVINACAVENADVNRNSFLPETEVEEIVEQ